MRISIWQQFSSNNSSSFTVVGVFENAEAAQRAADEVRQMIETIKSWYNEHPNEAGNYLWSDETSTPPEVEIGNRFGFEWPGAVEWYWNASVEVVLDRLVYITPNGFRPDTAGEPFDKVLTGLGGQGMIDGNFYGDQIGIILVDITCSAANEENARSIAEEELDYKRMVREGGTTLHFYDSPFEDFDLPEFIEELKGRGCTDIQYRL